MEQSPAARFIDVLGRLGYKTQQQIADLLQIARPTAGTIVRQEREPSFADVSRLKQEHDEVNIDWIFTGRGEAIPSRKPTPPTPTNEMEPATSAAASDGETSPLTLSRGGKGTDPYVDQLLERIADQAKTIERLWKQNDTLLEGKDDASADAADLYEVVDQIQSEYVAKQAAMQYDYQRFPKGGICKVVRMEIAGFGRQIA